MGKTIQQRVPNGNEVRKKTSDYEQGINDKSDDIRENDTKKDEKINYLDSKKQNKYEMKISIANIWSLMGTKM